MKNTLMLTMCIRVVARVGVLSQPKARHRGASGVALRAYDVGRLVALKQMNNRGRGVSADGSDGSFRAGAGRGRGCLSIGAPRAILARDWTEPVPASIKSGAHGGRPRRAASPVGARGERRAKYPDQSLLSRSSSSSGSSPVPGPWRRPMNMLRVWSKAVRHSSIVA